MTGGQAQAKNRPNIVILLADDMGYGDVGAYNPASLIPTPHMDAVAREGMRFTDAHSSSAVCTPSRYSLLTGRYCWRTWLQTGVLGGFGIPLIEPGRATLASLLREQGYATAAVGKWHLGFDWTASNGTPAAEWHRDARGQYSGEDLDYTRPLTGGPLDHGFDSFFGIAGSLDMPPYCFIQNRHTVGIPDRTKEVYYNQQRAGLQTPDWNDAAVDTTFTEQATSFIADHVHNHPEQPFFLYFATASPHRPCDIRPAFVEGQSRAGDRGDMVVLFDWIVGQVTAALASAGAAENTLLIITSDNGARTVCADGHDYGHRSNGPLRGQKADIWDGGHREPLLVRWPDRVQPGTASDALVCLTDLFASCCDLTETERPPASGEDSESILPLLLDEPAGQGRAVLVHHSLNGWFAVREGPWKLITRLGSGGFSEPRSCVPAAGGPEGQLYHMGEDVAECRNLWLEYPDIVARLEAHLVQAGAVEPQ